ncbi:MAG: YidC/Oxa1 family insertase periplasmic-domain containing protein, partial [bacterium]
EETGADIGMPPLEGVAGLTLLGEEEKLDLSKVGFTAYLEGRTDPLLDGSTVSVSETNPERTIVFRAEGTNGRVIEKTFTFTHDSYLVRAGVHFSGTQFPFVRDAEWGLGAGLRAVEANPEDDYHALRANLRLGDEYHTVKRGDYDEVYSGTVQWAALQIKYFTAFVMTEEPATGAIRVAGDKAENFITASITLPAVDRRGVVDQTVDFYFGPIDYGTLKSFGRGLEHNVDMGMAILRPVSRGVLWSLKWLHNFIPNYALGGSLPMLLQMPVFIALFNVLRNTIELRRAPFFGWITDLSQQDVLTRLPFSLPVIGNAVSVLPIIMGVGMLLQSKIGGGIAGPSSSTTQPKMMTYMMPILFTVLFYKMPSGLVVYWIVNTVMSVGQQYYINKGADKADREKAVLEEKNNKRAKPNRAKTKAKGR